MATKQQLALPLTVTSTGRLAALEQDSPLAVAQSVALLLDTRPGERRLVPDYGLADLVGVGIDQAAIAAAIDAHEPRAVPAVVEQLTQGIDELALVLPASGEELA